MDGESRYCAEEIVPKDETWEERRERHKKLRGGRTFPPCWSDGPLD